MGLSGTPHCSVTYILKWWNLAQLYLTQISKKYMNHVAHPFSSADISSFAILRYTDIDLYLVGFCVFAEISEMLKKKRLEKLVYPVKWSTWLYASNLPNFARRHFFNVNEVSNVFFWERDDKRGRLSKSFKDESLSVT